MEKWLKNNNLQAEESVNIDFFGRSGWGVRLFKFSLGCAHRARHVSLGIVRWTTVARVCFLCVCVCFLCVCVFCVCVFSVCVFSCSLCVSCVQIRTYLYPLHAAVAVRVRSWFDGANLSRREYEIRRMGHEREEILFSGCIYVTGMTGEDIFRAACIIIYGLWFNVSCRATWAWRLPASWKYHTFHVLSPYGSNRHLHWYVSAFPPEVTLKRLCTFRLTLRIKQLDRKRKDGAEVPEADVIKCHK